jgi:hypothetical protein
MSYSKIAQGYRTYTFNDGTVIKVSSIFGKDYLEIDTTVPSGFAISYLLDIDNRLDGYEYDNDTDTALYQVTVNSESDTRIKRELLEDDVTRPTDTYYSTSGIRLEWERPFLNRYNTNENHINLDRVVCEETNTTFSGFSEPNVVAYSEWRATYFSDRLDDGITSYALEFTAEPIHMWERWIPEPELAFVPSNRTKTIKLFNTGESNYTNVTVTNYVGGAGIVNIEDEGIKIAVLKLDEPKIEYLDLDGSVHANVSLPVPSRLNLKEDGTYYVCPKFRFSPDGTELSAVCFESKIQEVDSDNFPDEGPLHLEHAYDVSDFWWLSGGDELHADWPFIVTWSLDSKTGEWSVGRIIEDDDRYYTAVDYTGGGDLRYSYLQTDLNLDDIRRIVEDYEGNDISLDDMEITSLYYPAAVKGMFYVTNLSDENLFSFPLYFFGGDQGTREPQIGVVTRDEFGALTYTWPCYSFLIDYDLRSLNFQFVSFVISSDVTSYDYLNSSNSISDYYFSEVYLPYEGGFINSDFTDQEEFYFNNIESQYKNNTFTTLSIKEIVNISYHPGLFINLHMTEFHEQAHSDTTRNGSSTYVVNRIDSNREFAYLNEDLGVVFAQPHGTSSIQLANQNVNLDTVQIVQNTNDLFKFVSRISHAPWSS